jgi:hypothetical protein
MIENLKIVIVLSYYRTIVPPRHFYFTIHTTILSLSNTSPSKVKV